MVTGLFANWLLMRYLLFGSNDTCYAQGGAHDYLGSGDNIDALATSNILDEGGIVWWHIFDTATLSIVAGTEQQAYGAVNLKQFPPSEEVEIYPLTR